LNTIRNINIPQGRRLFFTPGESSIARLLLTATGMSENAELCITSSNLGIVNNGKVELSLEQGKRIKLDVAVAEEYDGPIELDAICIGEVL